MHPLMNRLGVAAVILLTAIASTRPAAAADDGGGRWWVSLSPYVWLPSLDGNVTIGDEEGDADDDIADSVDFFDTYVNWGAALHTEVGTGRFGFIGDGMYVNLHSDRETTASNIFRIETEGFIGELGAFYTLIGEPIRPRQATGFRLDAVGGVRISNLKFTIDSDGILDDFSSRATKYDPVVGARAELGLLNWLSLRGRADIGGFGISDDLTSDLTWSVAAGAAFHFGDAVDLELGYRYLKYDFEEDDLKIDLSLGGPFVGLTFWL